MFNAYRSLGREEKALIFVAALVGVFWIVAAGNDNAGIVAAAQVTAAVGTLTLAALAYAQVREMRETRLAQERPQVIVDADYSRAPLISVVVRNIGKGAAKNIRFEFSEPMPLSWNQNDPDLTTLDKLPMFEEGIDFLAPGAELSTAWDSLISLNPLLRERGLEGGFKITSKYESIAGEYAETPWTINPIRAAAIDFGEEKGIKDIAKAVEGINKDFRRVVNPLDGEIAISTDAERRDRRRQREEEREQDKKERS